MSIVLASASSQHYTRSGFFASAANAITLMAWCKVNALPGANEYHNLLVMGGVAGAVGCNIHNNAGTIRWSIGTALNDYDATTFPAPAVTDPWVHVAVTRNTNGDLALYVNGVLVRSATESFTGQTALWIGVDGTNDAAAAASHWDGPIAAVKAWDGCALTRAEIGIEQRQNQPAGVRLGQLKGFWPFVSVNSDTLDWSGHSQTLTRTGTPTTGDEAPVTLYARRARRIVDVPAAAAGGSFKPFWAVGASQLLSGGYGA